MNEHRQADTTSLTPAEATFAALLALSVVHFALGMALFVRSRRWHPIKGHSLPLVCLNMLGAVGVTLVNAASRANLPVPCWARLLFVFDFTTLATVVFITRAWRIFIHYRQQAEKLNMAANVHRRIYRTLTRRPSRSALMSSVRSTPKIVAKSIEDDNGASSMDRGGADGDAKPDPLLAWFTDRKLFVIALASSLTLMLVQSVPFFVIGDFSNTYDYEGMDTCDETNLSIYITSGVLGFAVFVVAYTLRKLRLIQDGYLIKAELACVTVWGFLCGVVYALPTSVTGLFATQVFMTVLGNAVFFHTVTWKVYRAWVYACHARDEERSKRTLRRRYTLELVLDTPKARAKFETHLHHEWAVENLLFYMAVRRYAVRCAGDDGLGAEQRARMAKAIHEQFIEDDSTSMVNISSRRRIQVMSDVSQISDSNPPSPSIFDGACDDIFRLMKEDSFVRFRRENSFEELFGGDVDGKSADAFTTKVSETPEAS